MLVVRELALELCFDPSAFSFEAALLGFARALGEFGATIVLAGNIPGRTQTLASAIFSAQQRGDTVLANKLVWVALLAGFAVVYTTERISSRGSIEKGGGK